MSDIFVYVVVVGVRKMKSIEWTREDMQKAVGKESKTIS